MFFVCMNFVEGGIINWYSVYGVRGVEGLILFVVDRFFVLRSGFRLGF